jgi:hypothetical protein
MRCKPCPTHILTECLLAWWVAGKDQAVARLMGEIQKVEEQRKELRYTQQQLEIDLKARSGQRIGDEKALERNVPLMLCHPFLLLPRAVLTCPVDW